MNPPSTSDYSLSREQMRAALPALSETPEQERVTGKLCLFGGAAMALAFGERREFTDGKLPRIEHLKQAMPVPQYLPALKCMAARRAGAGVEGFDLLEIAGWHDPASRIPVKTQYLIEGLFGEGCL